MGPCICLAKHPVRPVFVAQQAFMVTAGQKSHGIHLTENAVCYSLVCMSVPYNTQSLQMALPRCPQASCLVVWGTVLLINSRHVLHLSMRQAEREQRCLAKIEERKAQFLRHLAANGAALRVQREPCFFGKLCGAMLAAFIWVLGHAWASA